MEWNGMRDDVDDDDDAMRVCVGRKRGSCLIGRCVQEGKQINNQTTVKKGENNISKESD